MKYARTQSNHVFLVITIAVLVTVGVVVTVADTNVVGYWLFAAAITFVMAGFSRLTVTVGRKALIAAFGFGWPRRIYPMNKITGARTARNRWYHGWGVRRYSGGWIYNVAGFDAVEIDLSDGRQFRIGTDDPEGLLAAINANLAVH